MDDFVRQHQAHRDQVMREWGERNLVVYEVIIVVILIGVMLCCVCGCLRTTYECTMCVCCPLVRWFYECCGCWPRRRRPRGLEHNESLLKQRRLRRRVSQ